MSDTRLSHRAVEYILTRQIGQLKHLNEAGVAAAVKTPLAHLRQVFVNDQTITLEKFIEREKIHIAIFILEKNKTMPIDELAAILGFPAIDDFIAAFKEYIGIEPAVFRDLPGQ